MSSSCVLRILLDACDKHGHLRGGCWFLGRPNGHWPRLSAHDIGGKIVCVCVCVSCGCIMWMGLVPRKDWAMQA